MIFFSELVFYLFYFVMLALFIGIGLAIICVLFWLREHKSELVHNAHRWFRREGGLWWRITRWHRRQKRLKERARHYHTRTNRYTR